MGRTRLDRRALARAFIAKAVCDVSTAEMLIERLKLQPSLRRLCGFERRQDIPSSAAFSRAFAEFANLKLGYKIHEAPVLEHVGNKVVMHVSRDSTEVAAREKPTKKEKPPKKYDRSGRFHWAETATFAKVSICLLLIFNDNSVHGSRS